MVLSLVGLRPERDCAGKHQKITDPSSRQRGRYKVTDSQLSKEKFQAERKIGGGSQMSARHHDELVD
jgi:hypothetical protein